VTLATTGAASGNTRAIAFALVGGLVRAPRITFRARTHTGGTTGFPAGGRAFSGRQNGLALAGGSLPAASGALVSFLLSIRPGMTFLGMSAGTAETASIAALTIGYVVVGG